MWTKFFSISGVWILEFFFVIVLIGAPCDLSHGGIVLMNRPLFFFFVFFFAMSGVSDSYVRVRFDLWS